MDKKPKSPPLAGILFLTALFSKKWLSGGEKVLFCG
jgi:hypothetical protein